jgi:hypothetical protein
MGDIYVHVRMKKCCREMLARIDEESKKANVKGGIFGVESLAELLGEKTIDAAKAALPGGGPVASMGLDAEMEKVTRAICAKLCEVHAGEHAAKGEMEEGGFWQALSTVVTK